ncbi:MAG: hypothetical protein JRD68_13480 [Deltaproteobacteria bacterium]|nr:hypothetical protein [Deltaproteobacteria bacterium]
MVNPVSRPMILNPAVGAEQMNRIAWRDQLQAEILQKVRSVSTETVRPPPVLPTPLQKGEHLDLYI